MWMTSWTIKVQIYHHMLDLHIILNMAWLGIHNYVIYSPFNICWVDKYWSQSFICLFVLYGYALSSLPVNLIQVEQTILLIVGRTAFLYLMQILQPLFRSVTILNDLRHPWFMVWGIHQKWINSIEIFVWDCKLDDISLLCHTRWHATPQITMIYCDNYTSKQINLQAKFIMIWHWSCPPDYWTSQ